MPVRRDDLPARVARWLRATGLLQGAGASLLIASGYVACIVGIRWLLAPG
jgi:type IV secretory pathway TrbD component